MTLCLTILFFGIDLVSNNLTIFLLIINPVPLWKRAFFKNPDLLVFLTDELIESEIGDILQEIEENEQ